MNNVSIIGRLVKDPEMKRTEEGKAICNLRFAIDDPFSKEDRSDFISVTAFGNQGELCERYLRKGFLAGVSGRIRCDVYKDKEGANKYPIKIIAENVQFLQWPDRAETQAAAPASPAEAAAPAEAEAAEATAETEAEEEEQI